MDLGLRGKSVVVTGGASGIGRESARYFAREGARVLVADINEENVADTVDEIRGSGGEAAGAVVDVRDHAACEGMAAEAVSVFGGIDVCVACAGVGESRFFLDSSPESWNGLIDVNVRGVLNTNHAVASLMKDRGGSIVNIASEAGKVGERRIAVYSATKGAVISFTKAFAAEMGRYGVRVNAVCPGVVMTPMTADPATGYVDPERYKAAARLYPLGRLGEPEDIAAMVTFLASEQAGWITGQAISVNGGFGRS